MSNRFKQFQLYIILSGVTAGAQYTIQGVLGSAHNPLGFPQWFWVVEFLFWSGRALLEAFIVSYLFSTNTKKFSHRLAIGFFEILLLAMIAFTVGLSYRALGYAMLNEYASVMLQSQKEPWYTLWTFGLGAYTATMMAAAGTAYRVQPTDNGHTLVDNGQLAEAQAELTQTHAALRLALANERAVKQQVAQAEEKIAQLASEGNSRDTKVASALQAIAWIERQSPTVQIRLLTLASNGDKPTVKELSEWFGVTPPTASKARASVEAIVLKRESGE